MFVARALAGAAPGKAGPQSSSSSDDSGSEFGPVVGRSARSAGGGAGPITARLALGGGAAGPLTAAATVVAENDVGGSVGPVLSSESESPSSAISSWLVAAEGGGTEGPIDRFGSGAEGGCACGCA